MSSANLVNAEGPSRVGGKPEAPTGAVAYRSANVVRIFDALE